MARRHRGARGGGGKEGLIALGLPLALALVAERHIERSEREEQGTDAVARQRRQRERGAKERVSHRGSLRSRSSIAARTSEPEGDPATETPASAVSDRDQK